MLLDPLGECSAIDRDCIPRPVERVVARGVPLRKTRMCAARNLAHRTNDPRRQDHSARYRLELVDDFLDRDDRTPGREHCFFLHAEQSPHLHVAVPVAALCVDDAHIWVECGHGGERFARERAFDRRDRLGVLRKVGAHVTAQHAEWQACSPGGIARGHASVTVLFDLQRVRPTVLDCVAETLQRTDAGIAAPRESETRRTAGTDQLVVHHVGCHPNEVEVASTLTDDLVTSGVRNQVREPFHRHRVAVVHYFRDRLGEAAHLAHRGYQGGSCASTLIQMLFASVYSRIASKPISRP